MKKPFDRWLIASIAVLATAILVNAALAFRYVQELHADASRLTHTHEVIAELGDLLATMKDAENSQRAYVITADERYLGPFRVALSGVDEELGQLRALTADEPEQETQISRIEQLERAKLDELAHTVQVRDEKGLAAAQREVLADLAQNRMDELSTAVSSMRDDEANLMRARQEINRKTHWHAVLTSAIAAAAGLLSVIALLFVQRRDLRARVTAAAVLHEQREWFRTTLGSIGDGVIATDTRSRVIFANSVAETLTGWNQEEAEGRPLTEVFRIVNEKDRGAAEDPASRALRDGTIMGLANHTILVARDGTEVPIDDSAAPIRDASDRVVGVVLVFRDVTERRRAERALLDADRRKDEFLAILSHELRNPLAPISMAVALLRKAGRGQPEVEELRDVIERQTNQLARLLDDLLDVSRIASGKIALRMEPVSVGMAIASAIESVRPLLDAQQQQLTTTLPATPLYVEGDLTRLAQIFANLLNNSAKYTDPRGHLRVTVEREGRDAVVRVSDDGIGIPADQLVRIFELFVQVEQPLERDRGGLGVGLSLVKRLVEMHHGTVEARSAGPGKGSEFIVRLPAIGAPATQLPMPRLAGRAARRRVLVADDNADSAALLTTLLQTNGHDVRSAHDGPAAIALAESFRPEVALLDIGMPKVNGYDVARRLRAELGDRVVLVAITGWGQEDDKRRASEAGFDHHLTKPVDLPALDQVLTAAPRARSATA